MNHSATIEIPKKIFEEIIKSGRRISAAQDLLEDFLLTSDRRFIKKMARLRSEHLHGRIGN